MSNQYSRAAGSLPFRITPGESHREESASDAHAMKTRSRSRRLLRAAFEAVAVLMLTALVTEVAFRLVHAVHPIYIFPTASYNRFRSKPGTLYYGFPANSAGFLDVETEPRKGAGAYRILGVGDSFAFGVVPYPANFLTVLENDLRARNPAIEVVNMGIPSADVGDYLLLLRKEGLRLDPDLVIVCFFIGNDFWLRSEHGSDPPSYLAAFLRYALQIRPDYTREPRRARDDYRDDAPTMTKPRYLKVLHRRIALFSKDEAAYLDDFAQVSAALAEIRDLCRRHGARLLVVVLPEEMQVSWDARRLAIESLPGYEPRRYDWEQPNRALAAELDELGVAYLDLYPTFREAGAEAVLYKPRDTHWNVRGNRLAAETIRDYLLRGDWLPR